MHFLYHLPTEYDTINNKYLKDIDEGKEVDLEDLRADLRRKHDRLVDSGRIEKNNEDGNDRKKGRSKLDLRNSSRENVTCVVKSVTKEQIVGHWIATKRKGLPDTTTKMILIKL